LSFFVATSKRKRYVHELTMITVLANISKRVYCKLRLSKFAISLQYNAFLMNVYHKGKTLYNLPHFSNT